MLFTTLRKHTKTIMWIIAILIVPAFVIWNIGSAVNDRKSGFAGKMYGKKISWKTYTQEKYAVRNQLLMQYGTVDENIDLDQQTWTRLALLHQAAARGVTVSNKELAAYIKTLPAFRLEELTPQTYAMIIAQAFQQSPQEFEEGARNSLKIKKLIDQLVADITVSAAEARNAFARDNEKASLSYILMTPEDFLAAVPLDNAAAIEDFYANNRARFEKAEQVDVSYIEIPFETFKSAITISDERMQRYYDNNQAQFVVKTDTATDTSTSVQYTPFADVKTTIMEILVEKEMRNRAQDTARQVMNRLYNNEPMADIAAAYGIKTGQTGPFAMFEEVPGIGLNFQFMKAAFELKSGDISEVIATPTSLYILKLAQKIPPHVPEFSAISEEVRAAYQHEQAMNLARERMRAVRQQIVDAMAAGSISFAEAAAQLNLKVGIAEAITRSGFIPEIGLSDEVTQTAFVRAVHDVSDVLSTQKGFCIISVEARIPVDEAQFEKEKSDYEQKVLQEKRSAFVSDWFNQIQKDAQIESYTTPDQPR